MQSNRTLAQKQQKTIASAQLFYDSKLHGFLCDLHSNTIFMESVYFSRVYVAKCESSWHNNNNGSWRRKKKLTEAIVTMKKELKKKNATKLGQ